MKIQIIIPIALGVILLSWYLSEKLKGYTMKALYIKIAVSMCFVATALAGLCSLPEGTTPVYGSIVILGQVLGLMGDVVLDLKYIDREREDLHTKSGFVFFGIGHVCFMIAMFLEYGRFIEPGIVFLIIPIVIGSAIGYIVTKKASSFGNDYGDYFNIVAVYCCLLGSAMVMAIVYAVLYGQDLRLSCPQPSLNYMAVGMFLFTASDLVLSRTYFGEGHERPVDIITNYIFYYGAQFLVALSVSCIRITG